MNPEKQKRFEKPVMEEGRNYSEIYKQAAQEIRSSNDPFRKKTVLEFLKMDNDSKNILSSSDIIVTIPVLPTGDYEAKYIINVITKFQKQSLPTNKFAVFLFINSYGAENDSHNQSLKNKILKHIEKINSQNVVVTSINWQGEEFSNYNMGYNRRVLYDMVALCKSLDEVNKETAIISFDADPINFSNRLLEIYYKKILLNPEKNELIAGNINWYGNTGNDIIDFQLLMFQVDTTIASLLNTVNNNRHKYPSEGNSGFKLSTLCRNHYDSSIKTGFPAEGDLIMNDESLMYSGYKNIAPLVPPAFVKTNPRRLIYQIINNGSMDQTWFDTWKQNGEEGRNDHTSIKSYKYSDNLIEFENTIKKIITDKFVEKAKNNLVILLVSAIKVTKELKNQQKEPKTHIDLMCEVFELTSKYYTLIVTEHIEYLAKKYKIDLMFDDRFRIRLAQFVYSQMEKNFISVLGEEAKTIFEGSEKTVTAESLITHLSSINNSSEELNHIRQVTMKTADELKETLGKYIFDNCIYYRFDTTRLKRTLDYNRKRYNLDNEFNEIKPQF